MSKLLRTIIDYYLNSQGFNGIPIRTIKCFNLEEIKLLIKMDLIEAISNDNNPHIKAFNKQDKKEKQIASLLNPNCHLYPTTKALSSIQKDQRKVYNSLLQSGWGQFEVVFFDVAVLENYFNNPQYRVFDMGYGGHISIYNEYADGELENIKNYGVAYGANKEKDKAVGAFIRDLAFLSEKAQMRWASYEMKDQGQWKINGIFYRSLILGEWDEHVWIYDALLYEQQVINQICNCIGIHHIFVKIWDERPDGYRSIIIPTKKNYYEFVEALEKIVANNISSKAFTGIQKNTKAITAEKGEGTIALLGKWLIANGRHVSVVNEYIVGNLKEIRKQRQIPAHEIYENTYDKNFYKMQNDLMKKAYDAMSCLRIMLSTHPLARNIKVPNCLEDPTNIVFY